MIHLIKLAVGVHGIDHLKALQRARAEARGEPSIRRAFTRNKPVRPDAADGSLYWVIKGVIRCRQKLLGFDADVDQDGRHYCLFRLDPEVVPVMPAQRAAFQGWRYLEPADAPEDLPSGGEPPADEMIRELKSLGLI